MNNPIIAVRPPRFAEWLMGPIRANRHVYGKVVIAATMINIFALVSSLFTMVVYNRIIPNNATNSLIALTIGLIIVLVFDFILKILRAYFVDVAGADIDGTVARTVFDHLLQIRLDHRRGSTGGLASMMRELETLREFFASATMVALVDVPFIVVTLIALALIGGWLVLVPLCLIPIAIIAALVAEPILDRLSSQTMGQAMAKQSVVVEAIGGLEMVKVANAGSLLKRRWADAVGHHARTSLVQRLLSTIGLTVVGTGQQIAYAGVVIAGVGMINAQTLTTGGLIACSILSGRAIAPLAQIAGLLSKLNATRAAYRQMDGLMMTPVESSGGNALKLARLSGEIIFSNVTFTYLGAAEHALNDVSFAVKPGEKIAVLGRVGSGKSTLARMILGLYHPNAGQVMIDQAELRQYDAASLRRHMGCVMQDTVLLSGTVRENIVLSRAEVDEAELHRVAKLSGTHDFIGRMANGYDLVLSDRGESLSGGQRQSIAIARALAGRPPILIMDEPTSAMDNQTEQTFIKKLETEITDRTVLLITHRMPLLRLVTRIILLENGKVIADGPRDAVLKGITINQGN